MPRLLSLALGVASCSPDAKPQPSAPRAGHPQASGSVCGSAEHAPLRSTADGKLAVPARHAWVGYSGRLDCNARGGPLLGFVGASVRLRFHGTGLWVKLRDFGGGTAETTNYFDVTVDGGSPRLLQVSPAEELYGLAQGLADGPHEVELFKRVEGSPGGHARAGYAQILGFLLQGRELLPVALPKRRLEFVGDSITCGYGNEVETLDPDSAHYTTLSSNGHKAYGAVTAALLQAQYSAVAYSGRGLTRNYAGAEGGLVPDMYLRCLPDDVSAKVWDPAQYVPDAVVINLGTNDYSTPGVDRPAFVQRYTQFLAELRDYYPEAALVAALGPMLTDDYPPGALAWTGARADVAAAVAARARGGDRNVHIVSFAPQAGPWGADWHPTVATHAKMAAQLSSSLRVLLGW